MKIIFAKYNSERLPKFQIVTKIIEENGAKKAVKIPLCNEASSHINQIYNNYGLLINTYKNINLCEPTLIDNTIEFKIVEGKTFEQLLKQALDNNNKEQFFALIKQYVNYIDSFVTKRQVKFHPGNDFIEVLGECHIEEEQDLIEVANIDLIFSNLFILDNKITQIDYEWVFSFAIPKSFIIWRALKVFFVYHGASYPNLINIEEVLSYLNINLTHHSIFMNMDESLQKYVFGREFKYMLNSSYLKPKINILEKLEHKNQDLELKNQELQHILNSTLNSTSWKITEPIRRLKKLIK